MPRQYTAAAVQFEPRLGDIAYNTDRLLALVDEAAWAEAKVIVTPEMGVTGYCWRDRAEVAPYAEAVPGPTTARFGALARQHDCLVVVGLVERDPSTDLFYNTAVLLGPTGILASYRKTHDFIAEPRWAAESLVPPPVVETEYGRLGLVICMDADYMEPSRLLGVGGCEVALLPTCWLDERAPAPAWRTRALENGMFWVAADRYGLERGVQFSGGSCILGPEGQTLAALDTGDGIVYASIDLDLACGPALFARRRPQAYHRLVSHTYLWNPLPFQALYGAPPLPVGPSLAVQVMQGGGPFSPNMAGLNMAGLTVLPGLAYLPRVPETRSEAEAAAEGREGPTVQRLMALAAQTGGAVVGSWVERAGEDLSITVALADTGGLRGTYRALHLGATEQAWATPGTLEPPVFDLPGGRVGLLWGADLLFPEAARLAALQAADVIAVSAALEGPLPVGLPAPTAPLPVPAWDQALPAHFHLARQRGYENNTPVAFANRSDGAMMGESGIFGVELDTPEARLPGTAAGAAGSEVEMPSVTARYPTTPGRTKELLSKRVPGLYAPLVQARPANS